MVRGLPSGPFLVLLPICPLGTGRAGEAGFFASTRKVGTTKDLRTGLAATTWRAERKRHLRSVAVGAPAPP